jgi:hypothetical protein
MPARGFDQWLSARAVEYLEPHLEHWIDRFLRSPEGQSLLADIVAEALADFVMPDDDGGDMAERVVFSVAVRLAARRPMFRERLLTTLAGLTGGETPSPA